MVLYHYDGIFFYGIPFFLYLKNHSVWQYKCSVEKGNSILLIDIFLYDFIIFQLKALSLK